MKKYEKAFDEYLLNYDKSVKEIRYKYNHCYKVEELMKLLAIRLNLNEEQKEVSKIIGLLHDIGRFEQVKKYSKCSDVKSGIDHADESCVYLFDEGHIRDFIDDDKYDQIIKDAVKNHNKYAINENVKGDNLLFAKMIRDMDKVDIFRVLSEEYTFEFNKEEITDKVQESINNKVTVDIHDKRTNSDDVLSFFALLYDINFKESFDILKETGNFMKYLDIISPAKGSEEELNRLKNEYIKYIEDVK